MKTTQTQIKDNKTPESDNQRNETRETETFSNQNWKEWTQPEYGSSNVPVEDQAEMPPQTTPAFLKRKPAAPAQAQPITEAYDIKNVDIRNLLTVVVGTLSNQTGESFDSALSRGKCADEILRRFNEMQSQIKEHVNALRLTRDHEKQLAEQRDEARAHAQRLADALTELERTTRIGQRSWTPNQSKALDAAREALAEWSKQK